jgi:site-specific DNA-cytosine methylase
VQSRGGGNMKWLRNARFADAMNNLAHAVEDRVGKKRIVIVDLFCGGGGFSTGAVQAGAVIALAVDLWEPAATVHHANHPHVPFRQHALGNMEVDLALIREHVQPYLDMGYHFHLHGSPPCQALSNASRRDPREGLPMVMHYLDLVRELAPDSWSMENVVPVRRFLPEDIPSLIIDSADLGVPQKRRRCFAGEGWEITKTHDNKKIKKPKRPDLPGYVSVLDALPHLQNEFDEILRERAIAETPVAGVPSELWTRAIHGFENVISLVMDSGRSSAPTCGVNPETGERRGGSGPLFRALDEPAYTIMSTSRNIGFMVNNASVSGSNSSRARSADADVNGPSQTVTGRALTLRTNAADGVNYEKIRSLTIEEMATLQNFPEGYDFDVLENKSDKHLVIGNAVCPAVGKAVIDGIILEEKK